jgi:LysM repeat protein
MKIVKIFGIVVGIHVFALVLIFANPGCSSSSKPTPAPSDTVAKADTPPPLTVPNTSSDIGSAPPPPITFNPDAPASAAPSSVGVRFTPTRPGTPAASTLVVEPVADVTPAATYAVKSGDSLWSIANKNKLTTTELASANNIKTSAVLKLGQKLIIPGKSLPNANASTAALPEVAPAKSNESVATKSPAGMRHTVASGETLGTIAQKYGVKQRDLALANNITDPAKLAAGKELVIPGWDPATPRPNGKSATKSPGSAPTTKPAAESRPSFTTPQLDGTPPPVINAAPPLPTGAVPVIRVDETPAPKNP